ncbi:uncharacterized protein LOC109545364 isoform X2 [Dendroctonus ponderosae]|uniref:uncharacterized protein LOC109545364 isoform X2 n=1 Tax=Dendroctonus ponderosae TaxID=77166 RepID=UPI002036221E|nr:uncharacterized protein LOC109545364 isoform X2 [Dendroctonus ponderosae]
MRFCHKRWQNGVKKMSIKPRFSSEIFYYNLQDGKGEASNSLWAESETVVNSLTTISEESPELVEEIPKPKRELKKLTWGQDSYEGSVLLNNLHGSGFYFAQQNGEKFFYDGLFYANKLEGYSQVFYENGTHFQGLFQKHRRFGPGILTHPDGTQDVGFWNGFFLSRLACVIGGNSVPSLASSAAAKTKLLCTKYMVPLNQNENDLVQLALEHLGVGSDEDNVDFSGVFNEEIRNPNSLFFHTQLFDEHFFGSDNCTIKVFHQELADEEEEEMSSVDGQAVERMENLKRKIHEVNETLQTFIVIRQSLERRVNKCKNCCSRQQPAERSEKLQAKEQLYTLTQKTHEAAKNFPSENSSQSLEIVADINAEDIEDFNLPASTAQLANYSDGCACAEEEGAVDLENLEEQLQNIWCQEIFYRNIRDELAKKLDRLVERTSTKPETGAFKLVHVNEVWAWNNENSLISMQKHAFKHRHSEDMVNFSVPSLILGNRKEFGAAGAHEEIGQKFLMACHKGKKGFVSECLRNNKIDSNLSDSRGNSGMFFAAASNQQDIIAILTNFGAKVDQLNDEQLTPLSLCFLKYIAQKNSCKDWEKAFLPGSERCDLPELPKWYDIKSFQSSTTNSSKTSTCREEGSNQQLPCSNLRIIDLLRKISNFEQTEGVLRPSCSSTYVFDLSCNRNKFAKQTQLESDRSLSLESIQLTIMTLLDYGANPSGCEVPHPPLVLSLFTENPDLVKEVIKANADIDVVIDENVSCLHIAASLNPSLANTTICRIIVKYGCNPNVKTSPNHWIDRKYGITGKLPENFQVADDGKNVLHLLCMRTDFEGDQSNYFCAVAKILLGTDLDLSAMYLGHTPLSLAVLAGNVKLVQCLIKADAFDPYKQLDYGMGNILTLFALKRFENVLPLDKCKAMLTALFEVGLNVLARVANSENATAFVEDEDTFFDAFVPKAPKKAPRDKSKKDKHYAGVVKEFLRSLARQTLIKQVQMDVAYLLFELTEEDMLNSSEIFATLASLYLAPEDLLLNLKKLFEYGKIEHDRLDKAHVKTVLDFVNTHKKPVKAKAKKSDKKTGPKPQEADAVETLHLEFERTLNLRFIPPKNLPLPGLDDPQKYLICYHCLRGEEKTLKICPRCQMVRFCSSQCNKLNLKLKTLHTCNVLFYDMANGEQAVISKGVALRELSEKVRQKCAARLSRMRESKLEEEERKLMQMWRADTYGTRFLQIKPLLDKAVTKKKGKQLNWDLGLLQGLLERNFRKHPGDASLYSLENLLIKLHGKDWFRILGQTKSEGTIRTKQSWSTRRSTLGGSTLPSMIFQLPEPEEKLHRKSCKCPKKIARSKSNDKIKANIQKADNEPKHEDDPNVNELELLFSQAEKRPVIRKLKKIPTRYQKFVEIVATYFPDFDISQWLLPYACCSGGQLFYRFCYNNDVFKESYSFT